MKTSLKVKLVGRVQVVDTVTNEIILDQQNAVHPQNAALAVGRALAGDATGFIDKMVFGTGGSFYNTGGQLVYRTPNTLGQATLYQQTYFVSVNEQGSEAPVTNSVIASAAPAPSISTIITVTAQLNANEPSGQASSDNVTVDPEWQYMFDEIGLTTSDDLLLSHLIFAPIEKTANRAFLITYTLTVSVS